MSRFVVVLLLLGLSLSFGCEKEIELDLPEEQRLVLLSNFSPDSLFRVSLATTLPINNIANQFPDYPANASIQLFESGNYVDDLIFKPGNGFILPSYVLNIKPKEKTDYSIKATVPGFPSIAASNRIPSPVGIEGLEDIDIYEEKIDSLLYYYNIITTLDIENNADTLQYFHLLAWQNVNGRKRAVSIYTFESFDVEILHEDGFLFKSNDLPATSKALSIVLDFFYDALVEPKMPVYIELRNVSEDYYRFHESVGEQEFSSVENQSVLSTEAYFIYNNIDGGIGNFSGYSAAIDSIEY